MKGARDSVGTSCADSSAAADTLYLSFEPSQPESEFVGIAGELQVLPMPGDTLAPFWHMGKGGENRGGLIIQFGPNETMPGPSPWPMAGLAVVDYDWTSTHGRLRFGCTLAPDSHQPLVPGTRYTIACVYIRGVRAGQLGCDRPACIRWVQSELVFGGGRDFWRQADAGPIVLRGAAGPARQAARAALTPGIPWNQRSGSPPGSTR
jgi:hypothetical protein